MYVGVGVMAENQPYFEYNSKRDADADFKAIKSSYTFEQEKISTELAEIEQKISELEASADTLDEAQKRELKQLKINRNKVAIQGNPNAEHLQALDKNPENYVALYSIKQNVEEADEAKATLEIDPNGELKLKIQMLHPTSANMEISDGKVSFSTEGMTAKEMHDMIAFLQSHGIVADMDNLKLENADEKTLDMFDEAEQLFEDEKAGEESLFPFAEVKEGDYEEYPEEEPLDKLKGNMFDDILPDEEEEEAPVETPKFGEQKEESYGLFGGKAPKKTVPVDKSSKDDFDQSITKWMNKNKRKNFSWFEGNTWDGWDTFTCYSSENPRQNRKPITIDPKTGEMKYNYEFKVYTKMVNGHLQVCFSLPPGRNLTDDQAYMITSALKDAGVKYVRYGKGMTDANEAIMRTACAKRLLVPTDHKIDFERYDKMINAAAQKVDTNSPEIYRYKYDLAMQMDRILRKKGIDYRDDANKDKPDCRRIRWAIGTYKLHPFRDLWEDHGLRDDYEKKLAEGTPGPDCINPKDGAKRVIGAKRAVGLLYKMFSENADQNVGYLLSKEFKSLNDKEKGVLRAYIDNNGLSTETSVRDMPPAALRKIYDEMCKTQEVKAKEDIDKEYLELLKKSKQNGSKNDPEEVAVRKIFGSADTYIRNMNDQLQEYSLPKIVLTAVDMDSLKHDFADAKIKAKEQNLIREYTPRKVGGRKDEGR